MANRYGLIHCHSNHSYDCAMSARMLLRFAKRAALDFMLVTDHDTISGSLAVRGLAKSLGLEVDVPIAAEYKTSHGDVIAAFIECEISARNFPEFVTEVRAQDGLLLLPHPYDNHKDVEYLAEHVDLIEVFNARSSRHHNEASTELALRRQKRAYWAPDAHISSTLGKATVRVEGGDSLKNALLEGQIQPVTAILASRWDLWLSQYVKAWKTRDSRLFLEHTLSIALSALR